MIYHATQLIADYFEEKDILFHIEDTDTYSLVAAGYGVRSGPSVLVRFISRDEDNDVAVRVFGLLSRIPKEKEANILCICSEINRTVRYAKFHVDNDGDVNMEYDFPMETPDEAVGRFAYEMFARFCNILTEFYHLFARELYANEVTAPKRESAELISFLDRLQAFRDNPITIEVDAEESAMP